MVCGKEVRPIIASLVLEWYNQPCRCANEVSRTRLRVYRNRSHIVYKEFDDRDTLLKREKGFPSKHDIQRFFEILKESNEAMMHKQDYSVAVCDGSYWKLKIRHSHNSVQKLHGALEYPLYGKCVERELVQLCEEVWIFTSLSVWLRGIASCGAHAFADKWLQIFTDTPRNTDLRFENEMGDDCFALGFEMDCGKAFERTYHNEGCLYSLADFAAVVKDVSGVELLGSAIFSSWRRITHWSCENGFSTENRAWFLTALNRLKELLSEQE